MCFFVAFDRIFFMKHIQNDLKTGQLKKVYLLFGEEDYLIRQFKKRLSEAACPADDEMNRQVFSGKGIDVRAVNEACMTMPFFAEKRVVIVENSGFFSEAADEVLEIVKNVPDSTLLIFCESKVDKRTKLYKYIKKEFYAADFSRLKNEDLMRWVLTVLKRNEKQITRSVMDLFLSRTGDDMMLIEQELDKLIAYCLDRDEITADDVRAVCSNQIQDNIFAMIDAIAAKDSKKALRLYQDLLYLKEPPIKILVLITRQFHNLMREKDLLSDGKRDSEIASRVKIPPFAVKRHLPVLKRFSTEELKSCFETCLQTDQDIKSGQMQAQIGVELLIVQLSS